MKFVTPKAPLRGALKLRIILPEMVALMIVGLIMVASHTPLEGYDWLRLHSWHKLSYREGWMQGEWSQWNPFVAMGRPTFAEIEAAIFYPPNLLFLAGPVGGLILAIWGHLVLGIRSMLALMRSLQVSSVGAWFSALAWILGAPLLGRLQSGQIQVVFVLAWLPLLLLVARRMVEQPGRRMALRLAAVAAMIVLAGSPPMAWIMGWMTLVWMVALVWVNRIALLPRAHISWFLAAGLLALGLSAVQVIPFLELAGLGNRSARVEDFVLEGSLTTTNWWSLFQSRLGDKFFYWEYNLFSGALVVAFALLGVVHQQLRAMSLAWIAMGAGFAILALGGETPLLPFLAKWVPGWDLLRYPSRYAIVTVFSLIVLAGIGMDFLLSKLAPFSKIVPLVLGLLIGVNSADSLRAYFERQSIYTERFDFATESALTRELQEASLSEAGGPPPRVLVPSWLVRSNVGMGLGFSSVTGFGNPALGMVWDRVHEIAQVEKNAFDTVHLPAELYGRPDERFRELALDLRWDFESEKFVKPTVRGPRIQLTSGAVRFEKFEPDEISLVLDAREAGVLLLAEPWYPGWTASVDGKPVSVELANGWMRSVDVPAGAKRVVFRYRQNGLLLGGLISLLSLGVVIGYWKRP